VPLQEVAAQMKVLYERVAGIDVHKEMVKVAIRSPGEKPWTRKTEVLEFRTFYGVLQAMGRELRRRGVTHVVMEASGIYTDPVYYALAEQDFTEVAVINPAHAKALKGHKTDARDCARVAELFECGLLRGSYIPPAELREVRDLTRYRMKTVQARTSEIQRLGKALESAGIKLGSVASSITCQSATAMIEALIDGERRGAVLADLAIGRMRTAGKLADLSMALAGRFTGHHALLCRLHLDRIAVFDDAVDGLDKRIAGKAARWQREAGLLTSIPGFGDVVAQAWLGEIGPAPHRHFASHEKLASWVTLCPGNNISARKRKHGRTGDAGTYIKPMLIQAAWAAIRVRGRLQARYNRLVRRFGGAKNPAAKKKAITAIAHTLLKIAYQVLKSGVPYTEPGADFYTRRESPEQKQAWLERQLQKLHPGCTVTVTISPPEAALPPGARPPASSPPSPGAAASPAPRPTRRTINAIYRFLAAARAKVRCRAPTGDPVIVSARKGQRLHEASWPVRGERSRAPSAVPDRICWSGRGRSVFHARPAVATSGCRSRVTSAMS
jgi:transposase